MKIGLSWQNILLIPQQSATFVVAWMAILLNLGSNTYKEIFYDNKVQKLPGPLLVCLWRSTRLVGWRSRDPTRTTLDSWRGIPLTRCRGYPAASVATSGSSRCGPAGSDSQGRAGCPATWIGKVDIRCHNPHQFLRKSLILVTYHFLLG